MIHDEVWNVAVEMTCKRCGKRMWMDIDKMNFAEHLVAEHGLDAFGVKFMRIGENFTLKAA